LVVERRCEGRMGRGNAARVERPTADLAVEQVEPLKKLLPECVGGGRVDFESLKAALGEGDLPLCGKGALRDERAGNLALKCRLKTI
jgi:hypothetical protein